MIKTRRWNDPIEPDDGTRILITRYRPRGVRKEEETWSEWIKDLAPSAQLLAAFQGKEGDAIGWGHYRTAYLREMLHAKDAIATLAGRVLGGEAVTLLCSAACVRENRCHRSLLRQLLMAEIARRETRPEVDDAPQ